MEGVVREDHVEITDRASDESFTIRETVLVKLAHTTHRYHIDTTLGYCGANGAS
jgi:hypothetical protein